MKLLSTLLFLAMGHLMLAQSTMLRVYEIFQQKCVTCHDNATPQAGLDLEGAGASALEKAQDVFEKIVEVSPANSFAADKGYQYIFPGRTDKSFIFRKINGGLEPTLNIDSEEMQNMPPYGSPVLSNVEKELIRQWIAYGAPQTGQVVSESLIEDFYTNNGEVSFPDGPPEAPNPSEGFQIKMGPFYLEPGGEVEYFQKYQLDLPEDVDVDRVEVLFSNYSHHFIIYDYETPSDANNVEPGYREYIDHNQGVGIVTSVAEPTDLRLPEGTAFIWEKDIVLDLNAHYINYSAFNPYQAEAYVNVYTKPAGTATQEMNARLIPNPSIYIPNNGNETLEQGSFTFPNGEIWIWILGGHTHRYGTGYKIWRRTLAGEKGELLYDGSCPQGEPGCISPFFDYQHIPPRYFDPLIYVDLDEGIIHEATYVNDGPSPVWWGPTSQDEMMLFGMYFLTDTTGLSNPTNTFEPNPLEGASIYPNPNNGEFTLDLPIGLNEVNLQIYDVLGKEIRTISGIRNSGQINVNKLPKGMYLYRITDSESGRYRTGKLIIE